jgi:hypothetical protein
MGILNRIFNWKKNKDNMISEEQLINYKQNFTGVQFQWIKTDDPTKIGKVVKCRDIDMRGIAHFDDGSSIPAKNLNRNLMMIHGDVPPMSMDEVKSIYQPKVQKMSKEDKEKLTPAGHEAVTANQVVTPSTPIAGHQPTQPLANTVPPQPAKPVANPFAMFNSDEVEFTIKTKIKIPDKKLLKMMYNNAENKEEFIEQLSEYVTSLINNKVVKESLDKMLNPTTKKKPSTAVTKTETAPPADEIILTEVNNNDDKQ